MMNSYVLLPPFKDLNERQFLSRHIVLVVALRTVLVVSSFRGQTF